MSKTFSNEKRDPTVGPPNAERRGVRHILRNSMILAAVAMAAAGVIYFTLS